MRITSQGATQERTLLSDLILPSGKYCTACAIWKPFAGFPRMKYGKYGYAHLCKPCYSLQRKAHSLRNRAFAPVEKHCSTCTDVFPLEAFTLNPMNPDGRSYSCKECLAKKERDRYNKSADATRKSNRKLRLEVLRAYSGEIPSCDCCNEQHSEFLCVDHIGGGGNEHRRRLGLRGGTRLYAWLRKQGFPPGYRILCHNCNHSLGARGYCPHQERKTNEEQKQFLERGT